MQILKEEISKFTLVGAANFGLTFIVFTSMLKILGVSYLISLITAWIIGIIFSYILNFLWVFKMDQKIQFKAHFTKYVLAGLFSVVLNILILSYIVEEIGLDPFWSQLGITPFLVLFNFTTAKLWSLKKTQNKKQYG